MLPLCFGEATKFSRFLLDADKAYESTFVLGEATTTGDAEGEVIERGDTSKLTEEQLRNALQLFQGEIEQVQPPRWSVIRDVLGWID